MRNILDHTLCANEPVWSPTEVVNNFYSHTDQTDAQLQLAPLDAACQRLIGSVTGVRVLFSQSPACEQ